MSNSDPQSHKDVLAIVMDAWVRSASSGRLDGEAVRALKKAWRCGPPEWKSSLEKIASLHGANLAKSDAAEMKDRLVNGLRDTLAHNVLGERLDEIARDLEAMVEDGSLNAADAMRLGRMMGRLEDRVSLGVNGVPVKEAHGKASDE